MPDTSHYDENMLQHCCDKARKAHENDDENAIAACVVKDGEIIGDGANTVDDDMDATRHAEINAIANAGRALGNKNLSGCILYSSLQPCEMCMAAAAFSGIEEIYFAAEKANVAEKYFQFPSLTIDDYINAAKGPFMVKGGMLQSQIIDLYADGEA